VSRAGYISPQLGSTHLSAIDTAMVCKWRSDLLRAGVSQSMAAKAYRLLRAVLMTAVVEDKMIPANPCQIRGAGVENAPERPVLSVADVFELADRMKHPRYRALILLSVFGTLRWGEVSGLRRRDLAPDGSWVRVSGALVELRGKGLVYGPPKARASLRINSLPQAIRPVIVEHLAKYVKKSPDAWVFTGDRGNPIRSRNRNLLTGWKRRLRRSVDQVCIFMISGTLGTRLPRRLMSVQKISWRGWVRTGLGPR
jgi:integrase